MCTPQITAVMQARRAGVPSAASGFLAAGSQYVPGTIPLVPVRPGSTPRPNAPGTYTPNTPTPEQKSRTSLLGGGRKSLTAPRRTLLAGDYGGGQ